MKKEERRFFPEIIALILLLCFPFLGLGEADGKIMSPSQKAVLDSLGEIRTLSVGPLGLPRYVSGRLGFLPDGSEAGARAYLQRIQGLWRGTGMEELRLRKVEAGLAFQQHWRFQQYMNGLPVYGAQVILHSNPLTMEVLAVNGDFVPWDEHIPSSPALDADSALALAQRNLNIQGWTKLSGADLGYCLQYGEGVHLTWEAACAWSEDGVPHKERIFVDAVTGEVVARFSLIRNDFIPDLNKFKCPDKDGCDPEDELTCLWIETLYAANPLYPVCYQNLAATWNFYHDEFGRDSYDGNGAAVKVVVEYPLGAQWDDYCIRICLGAADAPQWGDQVQALDIMAHEFTHAITYVDLAYGPAQWGGISESLSDIFAACVEFQVEGPGLNVWKCGEDAYTPQIAGDALRYMYDPTLDGNSYDYFPEIANPGNTPQHYMAGVSNLAFYLLCQGGVHPRGKTSVTVPAIGIGQAQRIFYEAISQLPWYATFEDLRNATADAALGLYSADIASAVNLAWDAVGVPPYVPPGTVPGSPVLTSPANNATVCTLTPTLKWSAVTATPAVDYYQVQINNGSGTKIYASGNLTATNFTVPAGILAKSATYAWYVRAHNYLGWGGWSGRTIQTGAITVPPSPVLTSPANGATVMTTTPTLKWDAVAACPAVDYYQVQINNSSGTKIYASGNLTGTSFAVPAGKLQNGASYAWYVRAHNSEGWGGWSGRTITVCPLALPAAPTTIYPSGGSTISTTTPTLKWSAVSSCPAVDIYQVQLNTADGTDGWVFEGISGTSFTVPSYHLEMGKTYEWFVQAHNAQGWGPWSARRTFRVQMP